MLMRHRHILFLRDKPSSMLKCCETVVDFVFPPTVSRRVAFWADFEEVINGISVPAFFGGDFNCILSLEDRRRGSGGLSLDSTTFADMVGRLDHIDMGFLGSKFTWNRGPKDAPTWTEACVRHLPAIKSNHNPVYLSLSAVNLVDQSRRPFQFESMWTLYPQFMSFVESKWLRSSSAITALSKLKGDHQVWNKEGIEWAVANGDPTILLKLRNRLKEELENVLQQEEVFWFQNSREKWIERGGGGIETLPFSMQVPLSIDTKTTFVHSGMREIIGSRRSRIWRIWWLISISNCTPFRLVKCPILPYRVVASQGLITGIFWCFFSLSQMMRSGML
ncbi:hypothetical protein V2J09_010967 [Rumex salicifolius]